MKKILADAAYKPRFTDWVDTQLVGVEVEISSPPPSSEGFVPVKWRWVTQRGVGTFNFFGPLNKHLEKTAKARKIGCFGRTAKLSSTVWINDQRKFLNTI